MFNKIKMARRIGMFLIIGILYVGLNPDHCTAWDSFSIMCRAAVETGGTCASNGVYGVINGQLTDYGLQVCYESGYTDADIAEWQATAAANGVNNSASVPTQESNTQTSSTDSGTTNSSESTNSSSNSTSQTATVTQPNYTDEEIEAAWEETNRVESTCIEAGYIEYENALTGETKTETLELTDHDYQETERVDATCTEDGKVIYTCSVCGDTYEEAITATGHTTEIITAKEPTWFTTGTQQEVCSVCGEVISETELPQTCPLPLAGVIAIIIVIVGSISGAVLLVIRKNKLSK